MFDQAPCVMMLLTRDGRVAAINRAGCLFVGKGPGQSIGKLCGDAIDCPNACTGQGCGTNTRCAACVIRSQAEQVFKTGRATPGIPGQVYLRRNQELHVVDLLLSLAPVTCGGVPHVLVMALDQSEQKQFERALAQSEIRYRTILDASPIAIFLARDGRYIYSNPVGAQHLGLSDPAKVVGTLVEETFAPACRPLVRERMERCMAGHANTQAELTLIRADGSPVVRESVSVPIHLADGPAILIMGQDVTARKNAEEQIRLQAMVLDQLQDQVTVTDLQGRITYVNDAQCRALNRSRQELMGSRVESFGDNPLKGATQRQIIDATLDKGRWRGEVINYTSSGEELVLECRTTLVRDPSGEPTVMCGVATDITKRKRMEESLRSSEAMIRSVLNAVSANVAVLDRRGMIIEVNRKWSEFAASNGNPSSGATTGVGADYLDVLRSAAAASVDGAAESLDRIQAVLAGDVAEYSTEYPCHSPEMPRWFLMIATPLPGGGAVVAHIDITAQRQVREELEESEERFRITFDQSPVGAAIVSLDHRLLRANDALCQITGYSQPELFRIGLRQIIHPDDWAEDEQQAQRLISGEIGRYDLERRCIRKDGTIAWIQWAVRLMKTSAGKPLYLLPIMQDISPRKVAEGLLNARLRLGEMASSVTVDGLLQRALDEAEALTDSQIGFLHLVDADQEHLLLQAWSSQTLAHACTAEGKGRHYPINQAGVWVDCVRQRRPVIHNDYANLPHRRGLPPGHARVIRELVVPVLQNDRIVAILGVGNRATNYGDQDIEVLTQLANDAWEIILRKRAEDDLRRSEQRFRSYFELGLIGMAITSPEKRWVQLNDRLCEFLGYTREELALKTWAEMTHPQDLPADQTQFDRVMRGEIDSYALVKRFIRKDGETIDASISIRCVRNEDRTVNHFVAMVLDVTQQKRTEEALRASARLAATGRMAARIAHEVNNPLAGIKNSFLLIKDAIPASHRYFSYVNLIEKEIDRIARIVRQMYTLHRPDPPTATVFDLILLLEEVTDLARHGTRKPVAVVLGPFKAPLAVHLPEDPLRQVLFNVLNNAIDASPPSGEVSVRVECDSGVTIAITDQGAGVSPEAQQRLFEPFYTTKDGQDGGGMGLGLSVSRSLMEALGGELAFENAAQGGATFLVRLPGSCLERK